MLSSEKQKKIVVLGALSGIAKEAIDIWAEGDVRFALAGRDGVALALLEKELSNRVSFVGTWVSDFVESDPAEIMDEMVSSIGGVDIILLAYGVLGDQEIAEVNLKEAAHMIATNYTSAVMWCLTAASILEKQKKGTLIVIGSVAGDRGRASNYVYGSTKGGLAVFVQGIAHRLSRQGARAILIKPGPVDTPMTMALPKGRLWSKPQTVAHDIVRVAERPKRVTHYSPKFWRWIAFIIRNIPTGIFHKTRL